ncbi:hypothetical protein FNL39_101374 [Nocardia caishijiensis]|uniref:Uncharacterized protein n=1 Tax=Nocardia caishijiensis TaxID=184756 RepID=A0ABQ6YT14_9NOCA|nr:hypothetical protein FNL39_101374 [Nocardia caishijiensis]
MRVVIEQPHSLRRDCLVIGLLVLLALTTIALVLLPSVV